MSDARTLIASAVPERGGVWADLGAGSGTFTLALAELIGPDGRVYAVDRDANAMASLERAAAGMQNVIPVVADFTRLLELPGLDAAHLDGLLFANALHFIRDAHVVLARVAKLLKPGGRVVFVEYDRRGPSPWVPYPIPAARLPTLTSYAGLSTPTITATRASAYGGDLYVGRAERIAVEHK